MEKEKILIHKIKEYKTREFEDELAVEEQVCISLKNGEQILATCTPSNVEELILGRRYLAGDLEIAEESEGTILQEVALSEIFRIARDSFENPGPLFVETGCAHSCALVFEGKVVCCIEDIGRHNALDKVVGYALKHQISLKNSYIFTSGRISKDYLQKVIAAGIPMAVSRAAVTANAVELAKQENVTMLGFIRKDSGNLYTEGSVKILEG
jgi:formate dehydrogenase assembly factor FdhD